MTPLFVLLGILAVLVLWFVSIYNSLVHLRNYVDNAWAQIDVQLKRRHDLIPNLLETVKGYMAHERGTLEAITKAPHRCDERARDRRRRAKPNPPSPAPCAD